jgi:hypothetical protein
MVRGARVALAEVAPVALAVPAELVSLATVGMAAPEELAARVELAETVVWPAAVARAVPAARVELAARAVPVARAELVGPAVLAAVPAAALATSWAPSAPPPR